MSNLSEDSKHLEVLEEVWSHDNRGLISGWDQRYNYSGWAWLTSVGVVSVRGERCDW